MADDASPDLPPPPGEGSPLDELEGNPFGDDFPEGENPFEGKNPFAGGSPLGDGAFGNEPPAVMIAKLWIRQNALLSVGLAFAAGTLIGALQK